MKIIPTTHFKLSMRQRISFIVGLFILVNLLLLGLGYLQSDTMDSVRSYVRGEGLWAKAQKDAVFHLQNYVRTGRKEEYEKYRDSLNAPLGDHVARIQLQSPNPDFNMATKGFVEGQNHPDDIPGMIRFFLRFEHFPYMSDAIAIWTEADGAILELQELGEKIYLARRDNYHEIELLLNELDRLNWMLADKEYQFSLVLSEGARWVKSVLKWVSLGIFAIMLFLVMVISRRIVNGIERTEKDLMISENRFKSLYQTNMLGIIDWHKDGRILDANNAFLDMVGYSSDELINGSVKWRDLTTKEGVARDGLAFSEIEEKGYCHPFEKEFIHHDGMTRVPVYLGAALLDGERERGICFIIDHTEIKRAHTEMHLAATVFDASSDGIMITNDKREILTVNTSWCNLSGYSKDEVLGRPATILRSGNMPESFYKEMWHKLIDTDCWQGDVINCKKDGSEIHIRLGINAVRDEDQTLSHYVAIFTDISERVAAEDKLRKLAHYDFLTNLANRSLFNDLLKNTIQRSKRNSSIFAVLFVDLDKFKPVNDLYGHEVGDKLLQEVANRLSSVVRANDVVARLGGDEFVILLDDLDKSSDASLIANKVITELNQPVCIGEMDLNVGCSIGISIFPEDGEDSKGILNCADIAMYAAKADGRNGYFYFNSKNNQITGVG